MKQPTTLEVALTGANQAPVRPSAPTLADSGELDLLVHDPPTWRDHVHNLKGLLICCDIVAKEELADLHRRIRAELALLNSAASRSGQHAVYREMEANFIAKVHGSSRPSQAMPVPAASRDRATEPDQTVGAKIRLSSALESLHRQLKGRPPASQFAGGYDQARLVA